MNLFTVPIREITYEGVKSFCEQGIHEGISLDYKKNFNPDNKKLARSICAFANTYGGLILIGVDEDKDNKPKTPFIGIDHKKGFEDKITSIILDHISPPIIETEIHVCDPVEDKTFVVIRVPQSNKTPHAIYNQTKAYIRTGSRNKQEDLETLATMEQIEWLRDQRKKSEELRERICEQAKERYQRLRDLHKEETAGDLTLRFVPLYPKSPLFKENRVNSICAELKTDHFPELDYNLKPIQGGGISFYARPGRFIPLMISYTEINHFGLLYFRNTLATKSQGGFVIYLMSVLKMLDLALEAAGKFYRDSGYVGLIQVSISLANIYKLEFISMNDNAEIERNLAQDQLEWSLTIGAPRLIDVDTRQKQLIELAHSVSWAFGSSLDEESTIAMFQQQGRWQQ